MSDKNAKLAKAAAAQARAQAEAEQKRRDRRIMLIGGAILLVVMGGLIAIPFLGRTGPATPGPTSTAAGPNPTSVDPKTFGVKYGPAWTAANADSIPKLVVYEDFQCPACKNFEDTTGAKLEELVLAGKVRLEWRIATFLDKNLARENAAAGTPDSSLRAAMAWGCAIDAGKGPEFHKALFAAQPKQEGDGYSDQLLASLATSVGITGDAQTTWSDCFSSRKYEDWVNNSYGTFTTDGITNTPTGVLNGKTLDSQKVMLDPAAFEKAIADATGK